MPFKTRANNNGDTIYDTAENYDEEIVINNVDKNDLGSNFNSFSVKSNNAENHFPDKKLSMAMAAESQVTFEEKLTTENSTTTNTTPAENALTENSEEDEVELTKIDDFTNTEATVS